MTTQSHHDHVEKQFSSQASEYLTSTVHASGQDLQRLAVRLADYPDASVLDMGCGAGHASFVAAQNVSTVVAYDLSAHMLDVVAQAAEARQLKNITTRQGYVESLPFADNAFDIVISRYSAHHWHDVGAALREVNRVLKPGGLLIYSTCTYNKEEDEENVAWIAGELGAEVLKVPVSSEWGIIGNLAGQDFPVYRFLPHSVKGEGFFLAVLRKNAATSHAVPCIRCREDKKEIRLRLLLFPKK